VRIIRDASFALRWVSLIFVAAAIVLTMVELVSYSRLRADYPPGMTIAGVPVGGADPQEAVQRLLRIYNSTPVEIQVNGSAVHMEPSMAGFQIDTESMLAAADLQRTGSSFWVSFWDYLWNRQSGTSDVPLIATFSEDRLRLYLKDEIAVRYDQPSVPAQPIPGKIDFTPGQAGQELDIDRAVLLIEDALKSANNRTVSLTFRQSAPAHPLLKNLEVLVKNQVIDGTPFDGIVGFYLQDLQTGEELHFGYDKNKDVPVEPDIAFTASSTIKIPIMVSVYKNLGPNLDQDTQDLILEMITKSENPASDALMRKIDPIKGPLIVSADMKSIGLDDTFLGGYFCSPQNPCPLLQKFDTPANERTDISADPDVYNQTTTSDIGALLADLYQCSETGGGALVAAFPGKIDQKICVEIISYLKRDRIGSLIEAGIPDGTQIAHKHGWITNGNGIIQNYSDAAIVYSPGGNYILVIYAYHPVNAVFQQVSDMYAQISQVVYNYFNLPSQ
jgi:beta-lactamase class A